MLSKVKIERKSIKDKGKQINKRLELIGIKQEFMKACDKQLNNDI